MSSIFMAATLRCACDTVNRMRRHEYIGTCADRALPKTTMREPVACVRVRSMGAGDRLSAESGPGQVVRNGWQPASPASIEVAPAGTLASLLEASCTRFADRPAYHRSE